MPQPHKHKDIIIAWANGAQIQYWSKVNCEWKDLVDLTWYESMEYRIKPKAKVKKYLFAFSCKDAPRKFFLSTSFYKDKKDFFKRNQFAISAQRIDASMIEVDEE